MSQPPNTVLNGPSPENNVPFKDAQAIPETPKPPQNGNGPPQQFPGYPTGAPRPPLTRLDSRSSIQTRPGFPPGPGPRPQQLRQPPPGQQFVQRPLGPRPPGQPPFLQNRPNINPNFRPPTPFPRPPGPRQPAIFAQRSVPGFGQQRPLFEGELPRSQTLDSTDLSKPPENGRIASEEPVRPAMNALKNRSFSVASNVSETPHLLDEERRRSVSSIGSLDDKRAGSVENLDKRVEEDIPSRPESRAGSRMNRIVEDEGDVKAQPLLNKSPIPPADILPKSVDFTLPTHDPIVKSPAPVANKSDVQNNAPHSKALDEKPFKSDESVVNNQRPVEKKPDVKTLELKNITQAKSPSRSEGDNDSGVDESTQGNDQSSNGDQSSPRKSSGKIPSRTASTTPTKNRSLSRGSKSPSLKSPDSNASTPGTTEKKKLPMNKVQVGSAPSPNLKVVRSKIGSLENASYKPGGGKVKIESKKVDFKNAAPRIEAKNERYAPKGGDKKIQQQKLQWNAKSKIGSLENATHKPKGGDKKIESIKLDFKEKAKPKVGSKDNIKHTPGGGDVKIENKKLDLKVQSKVGSLDNVKHKPGGGEKKIFDDKEYLKQMSNISSENHSLSGSQKKSSKGYEVSFKEQIEFSVAKTRVVESARQKNSLESRPSSRLSRSASARVKKNTPRPPWRF